MATKLDLTKEWRSCKKSKIDHSVPFPEAKLRDKLAQNRLFAVPPRNTKHIIQQKRALK